MFRSFIRRTPRNDKPIPAMWQSQLAEPVFPPIPGSGKAMLYHGPAPTPADRCCSEVGITFTKLSSTAIEPKYATVDAVGMDLCADHDASIAPGDHKLILTNIAVKMPRFFEAQVRPRSGLALKKGITVLNSPGTIDPDYRGGIGVILYNAGKERFTIKPGDRIAQLVFAMRWKAYLTEVDTLDETKRGADGFGSTGV